MRRVLSPTSSSSSRPERACPARSGDRRVRARCSPTSQSVKPEPRSPRRSPRSSGSTNARVTGVGCWAETSLYDGFAALLPMILGRVEHHSASTRLLWQEQGPKESLSYRCADGRYVQLWFGAKGAYEAFLEHMGDPPSEHGYNADLMSGAMVERGARWAARFETRDRDWWVEELAGHDFRCEPVLRAGEALQRSARARGRPGRRTRRPGPWPDQHVGSGRPGLVLRDRWCRTPTQVDLRPYSRAESACWTCRRTWPGRSPPWCWPSSGPTWSKSNRITGDVHRSMEPMFAAGQRGKRAIALDLKAPDAPEVLDRLFRWCDVVHHNSQGGTGRAARLRRGHRSGGQSRRRLQLRQRLRRARPESPPARPTTS